MTSPIKVIYFSLALRAQPNTRVIGDFLTYSKARKFRIDISLRIECEKSIERFHSR